MNILVVREDGSYYVRPDTTLEREGTEFYLPGAFVGVTVRKCRCVRLKKAGKAVGERFADRYLEAVCGAGLMVYGVSEDGGRTPYIDNSTIFFNGSSRPLEAGEFVEFSKYLSSVTSVTSVRIGDYICIEGDESPLISRGQVVEGVSIL